MNINFIGKEFERLAKLEDFINYEYEPKSNLKYGKRNIYFNDIKLDFINEVNTYGFSPFILESFIEQRDDPNIMRFITKKFNHGLTNYIKAQTKELALRANKNKRKLFSHKSPKIIKNNHKASLQKKENLISSIFLIKKNEDKKKNEEKENFLQKALGGVGGHKLNISEEEDKDRDREKENHLDKKFSIDNNKKEKDKKDLEEKSNIELLKKIFIGSEKKNNNNNNKEKLQNLNLILGVNNFNKEDFKQGNLKSFLDKINKLPLDNQNYNNDKKVLTLSRNKGILGNKGLFSPISKNNFKSLEQLETFRKGRKMIRNKSLEPKNYREKNKFGIKLKINNKNKEKFLLFTKARPYRYMSYKDNNNKKIKANNNNNIIMK